MKRVLLTLATCGVLAVTAAQALATDKAIPYPMTAQMAAKYGIQHPGLPAQVRAEEAAHHAVEVRGYGHGGGYGGGGYGYHGRPGNYGHYGRPWNYGYRAPVIVYPPVYVPPYYYGYGPSGVFQYYGRGFSFGLGF